MPCLVPASPESRTNSSSAWNACHGQSGTKKGADYWGCCPFHTDSTPSFKVSAGRQSYYCFGCQAKGDVLDFLIAHKGLDTAGAIERLRELVGDTSERREPRAAPPPEPSPDRNRELAQEIWRQTETIAHGLPFEYLTRRRGLINWDCDRVRWHPACPWGRDRVGCIVAPVVCHRTGYTVGVWRIRPVMEGKVERLALGPTRGNCSPTWWPEGDELAIAEGIEDALAVRQLTGLPCWSALSSGFMAEMRGIPAWICRVTIFADVDEVGRLGAHALADRLRGEGRDARVVKAIGHKDPNDVLLAGRPAA